MMRREFFKAAAAALATVFGWRWIRERVSTVRVRRTWVKPETGEQITMVSEYPISEDERWEEIAAGRMHDPRGCPACDPTSGLPEDERRKAWGARWNDPPQGGTRRS